MLTQLQVINKILSSGDYTLISENNLSTDYFPNLKSEFRFIIDHHKVYNQTPDLATFLKKFPEFEVLEVKESSEYLINELYREKNENFLANSFNKMKDFLVSGKTDEAMELVSNLSQAMQSAKRLEAVDILSDISRYDEYLDKCNDFDKHFLSTGFKELDDALGGGIDRQNSYFIISARPGIGKTLIMVKFAAAAVEKGLTVGLYEGEMSVNKIAGRYDTLTSHISNGSINHGNMGIANQYKSYLDNLDKSSKGKFYVLTRDMVPDSKVTVDVLSNFVEKYNLDVLFIDQLSLLDSNLRNAKSFEQAAEISKSIKNLQVRKHIPVILASQQNRDATNMEMIGRAAGTENLSLSDRLGQDASEVIGLTKKDNILTINIAKARDGAKKYQIKYSVDFDKGHFDYIPDEDDDKSYYEEVESNDTVRPIGFNPKAYEDDGVDIY